jgi:hypothetical protein
MSNAQEFLRELALTTRNVPAEIATWWRDSHRWDRQTHLYIDEHQTLPSGGETVTMTWRVDPEYRLWRTLGKVSDALLLTIAVLIVVLIGVAI